MLYSHSWWLVWSGSVLCYSRDSYNATTKRYKDYFVKVGGRVCDGLEDIFQNLFAYLLSIRDG